MACQVAGAPLRKGPPSQPIRSRPALAVPRRSHGPTRASENPINCCGVRLSAYCVGNVVHAQVFAARGSATLQTAGTMCPIESSPVWDPCMGICGSLTISVGRHRRRHLAARGVAFDRAPVGVDLRPMGESLGSAAARRWRGPLELPEKATFPGVIFHVTTGRVSGNAVKQCGFGRLKLLLHAPDIIGTQSDTTAVNWTWR